MLSDILNRTGVKEYAAIPVVICRSANKRLYDELPENAAAVFALFPYYCDSKSALAAFASVPDYHIFAKELFSEMTLYINNKYPGAYAHGFSDHSPLDERHGAASAGLGIIGRHGLLISELHSSFVCIGEFITDLSIDILISEGIPSNPVEIKYCNNCGKCAAACPQGCVDSEKKRCISAINQKKGELTKEEQAALSLSGYAWGCDICQNACPYTDRARKTGTLYTEIPFFLQNHLSGDTNEILQLSDDEYLRYTFSYRKRAIMERNINILNGKDNCND